MGARFYLSRYPEWTRMYARQGSLPKWYKRFYARLERRRAARLIRVGESPGYVVVPKSEVSNMYF